MDTLVKGDYWECDFWPNVSSPDTRYYIIVPVKEKVILKHFKTKGIKKKISHFCILFQDPLSMSFG